MANTTLLKWWVQFVLICFAGIVAWDLGWWSALYHADETKISLAILALFVMSTLTTGHMSVSQTRTQNLSNYIWFSSEAMITLGMIGTVAGFLMMLGTAFQDLDVSEISEIQAAISTMAVGMSTALSTTLVGLVCSVITKVQMVILENSWENGS